MPTKTETFLAALLFLSSGSVVLGNTDDRNDHDGSLARHAASVTMLGSRAETVYHAVIRFKGDEKAGFTATQLAVAQSAPLCRSGTTARPMAWITLTEPGGSIIHINVEQVTAVRSNTQIPGAKAQLDLASGKLQGVQQSADEVMQLIAATAAARPNDECA